MAVSFVLSWPGSEMDRSGRCLYRKRGAILTRLMASCAEKTAAAVIHAAVRSGFDRIPRRARGRAKMQLISGSIIGSTYCVDLTATNQIR